jgi:hypothetical protein
LNLTQPMINAWTLDSTAVAVWGRAAAQGGLKLWVGVVGHDNYGISWHKSKGRTEIVCLVANHLSRFGSRGME